MPGKIPAPVEGAWGMWARCKKKALRDGVQPLLMLGSVCLPGMLELHHVQPALALVPQEGAGLLPVALSEQQRAH